MKRMLQLARARPRFGYRRIGGLLVLEGWRAGLSRVFRLWQREGLTVPQKKRKRRRLGMSANGCHRRRAEYPNDVWCWDFIFDRVGVSTLSIEPGSPWENGFAESFHSRFRDECLAQEIFDGLHDARAITPASQEDYNHRRPHGSLGFQTPAGFAAACPASASAKASAPAAHAAICLDQTQP